VIRLYGLAGAPLAARGFLLADAKVLVEQWRQHYNWVRLHSALGYRPPAPEAVEILPAVTRKPVALQAQMA